MTKAVSDPDASQAQHKPFAYAQNFAGQLGEISEKSKNLLGATLENLRRSAEPLPYDPIDIVHAFSEFGKAWMQAPLQLLAYQSQWASEYTHIWRNVWDRASDQDKDPYIAPASTDRRFRGDAWNTQPTFDLIKQTYLAMGRQLQQLVAAAPNLEPETRAKVDFFLRQYLSLASPTNFAVTNPDVLRKTFETGGLNLLTGLGNLLEDVARGDGLIKHRAPDVFEVGVNIAATPGSVIYQNDLMQLIQYDPSTDKVHQRPLLFVPPIVNKFYHFDLQPKSSYLKWLVDQGHTVFVISWVNPGPELAHKGLVDYIKEGPIAAIDAIQQATGADKIDIASFCIGGTLTAAALAYIEGSGRKNPVRTATLIATLLDFSSLGEFSVFLNDRHRTALQRHLKAKGYLGSDDLTRLFAVVRANDQIWSPLVTHYLMGEESPPSDLLFWFADGAHISRDMLDQYTTQVIRDNLLREPGGLVVDGVPLDLKKIKTPIHLVSMKDDHVAEWKNTFEGLSLFGGETHFLLGGSGHNAGTLSAPAANRHGYWVNSKKTPKTADAWFEGAEKQLGSWWPHWLKWVESVEPSEMVSARKVGAGKLKPIEPAPGSYVRVKS